MTAAASVLVLGVGQPDSGDDAVGPAVAEQVARRGLPGVRVLSPSLPLQLLDAPAGLDLLIVVDAVRTGAVPGAVVVHEVDGRGLPWQAGSGTHDFGLDRALALAAALGRRPSRVLLVGIEGQVFGAGAVPSAPVLAAIPRAAEEVVRRCVSA